MLIIGYPVNTRVMKMMVYWVWLPLLQEIISLVVREKKKSTVFQSAVYRIINP